MKNNIRNRFAEYEPNRERFLANAIRGKIASVQCHLPADTHTPISLFRKFDDLSSAFLLESVVGGERWARYSIMGRSPLLRVTSGNGRVFLKFGDSEPEYTDGSPIPLIRDLLSQYSMRPDETELPFRCGLIGYFAYDFIRYIEKLPDNNPDSLNLPDCDLIAPAEVMLYDHLNNEITLICNRFIGQDPASDYDAAIEDLEKLKNHLFSGFSQEEISSGFGLDLKAVLSNSAKSDYLKSVAKAKQYIQEGDIFQVVLSQRFSLPCQTDPFSIYRALRRVNPSPYMFFLRSSSAVLVGSSPEMLVRLNNGYIETCPIAGTRKRGNNREIDEALASELLADEKENAEHAMLVDLSRNDIGKISKIGSVKVKSFRKVEKYSHVMHLVSTVEGEIHPDMFALDVLASVLPAGTLSGAPKIRAMEIIDELEPVRRGPYGGAVGYLGFDGNMDTCITIRTAVIRDNVVHIQAGAGIVADSIAENEYDEIINKAGAMFSALNRSGEYT